ncbi:unnamed protein product [Prunus armeniaca]
MTMRKKQRLMDVNKKPPNDFHHLLPCMLVPNLQSFSPNLRPFGQMIGKKNIYLNNIVLFSNGSMICAKKEGSIVLQVCTIEKNVDRNTIQIQLNLNFSIEKKKKEKKSLQFN